MLTPLCVVCGLALLRTRSDCITCSDACRKSLTRQSTPPERSTRYHKALRRYDPTLRESYWSSELLHNGRMTPPPKTLLPRVLRRLCAEDQELRALVADGLLLTALEIQHPSHD